MKIILVGFVSFLALSLPCQRALAYSHGNRYGGSSSHSYGSSSHTNAYGGSTSHTAGEGTTHSSAYGTETSHSYGGGTSHTNAYGGSTSGEYGQGATHTNAYGGSTSGAYGEGAYHTNVYGGTTYASAYHPTAYYGYHPPTTVNYYGSTCANVNGWAAAAAVTTAAVATTAAISADANAAAANAYNSGYNAGATTGQPVVVTTQSAQQPAGITYSVGQTVAALPPGGVKSTATVQGATYYQCGNTWFSPAFGANGVYYRVVAPPGQSPQPAEKVLALMQQLQLTPEQEVGVLPILKAEIPQIESIKNNSSIAGMQKLQQFRAVRSQYAPQLQGILSPAQYEQLQGIIEADVRKAIESQLSE